ncbi:hypothetical protein K6119_07100 [Paracrocinitomix mangrovi]|uniref:hypothetical protein n=1 Tax=Paracrocinitomix mangrovi TaxID=2862509 RepID=UPI001C8F1DA1|nr:hypothetical protein [Paracrocinitomix mangrovi]UKN03279.1 hypothetical protein K6119_07100 [Paracrocinitomix mangrovi]
MKIKYIPLYLTLTVLFCCARPSEYCPHKFDFGFHNFDSSYFEKDFIGKHENDTLIIYSMHNPIINTYDIDSTNFFGGRSCQVGFRYDYYLITPNNKEESFSIEFWGNNDNDSTYFFQFFIAGCYDLKKEVYNLNEANVTFNIPNENRGQLYINKIEFEEGKLKTIYSSDSKIWEFQVD